MRVGRAGEGGALCYGAELWAETPFPWYEMPLVPVLSATHPVWTFLQINKQWVCEDLWLENGNKVFTLPSAPVQLAKAAENERSRIHARAARDS